MPLSPKDIAAYANFCDAVPDTPVFFYPWYLDAVGSGGDWGAALAYDGPTLAGVWPYFIKQRLGFRYITMPMLTKYMGPHLHPAYREACLRKEILAALSRQLPRVAGMQQNFSPYFTDPDEFTQHFEWRLQTTYRLHLETTPDWEANINRNMRRNIAKADKQLHMETQFSWVDFHRVNALSFSRQGLQIPYDQTFLNAHLDALHRHGAAKLFFACDDQNRIHGVACLIWDQHHAYYHLAGEDPALRHSGAGIWLMGQAIRYTQDTLHRPIFDFEGSMIPAIAHIRQQMGATADTYLKVSQSKHPLYKILRWLRT